MQVLYNNYVTVDQWKIAHLYCVDIDAVKVRGMRSNRIGGIISYKGVKIWI